ncbi:MAG: hypothetical protein ACE5J2_03010 [Nitrososphaerales archaeon]
MSKEERTRKESGKDRGNRLKEIALSESNTFSERMRAIDLLGELGDEAFDDLSDIASKGLTYSERMNSLDMLEKIIKRR